MGLHEESALMPNLNGSSIILNRTTTELESTPIRLRAKMS